MDFIDIDDDDDVGHENDLDLFMIDDDDDDNDDSSPRAAQILHHRNTRPSLPEIYIEECWLSDERSHGLIACEVKKGHTVETKSGEFLRVFYIIKNLETDNIKLRGLLFRRNKTLAALPRKLNEVHLVVTVDEDDARPWHEQGLEEEDINNVVKKRHLVLTDSPFPHHSFRETRRFDDGDADSKIQRKDIFENDKLVCRNLFMSIYGTGERSLHRRRPYQGVLRPILPHEADSARALTGPGRYPDDDAIRREAAADMVDTEAVIPVDSNGNRLPSKPRKLTFGDAFMGAGGASSGARQAGLEVKWGFDHNDDAVATARSNFPLAKVYCMDVEKFLQDAENSLPQWLRKLLVDILHLSPPCQPFSPAHTHHSEEYEEKDLENRAALLTVGPIIESTKPRIAVLEETLGLLTHGDHEDWFQNLLGTICAAGYSIRWGILDFREYGLPTRRKRLLIYASAPGIPLPSLPKPTHGPGLLPFTTVHDAIDNLPSTLDLHDIWDTKARSKTPYDAHAPLPNTITCGGTETCHPNGRRDFTLRELAVLQGFKRNYQFKGNKTSIKKQIGNACPPSVMKLIYAECVKVLDEVDGRTSGTSVSRPAPPRTGPVGMGQRQRPLYVSPTPPQTVSGPHTSNVISRAVLGITDPRQRSETLRLGSAEPILIEDQRRPKRQSVTPIIQEAAKKRRQSSSTVSRHASPYLRLAGLDGHDARNAIVVKDEDVEARVEAPIVLDDDDATPRKELIVLD